VILKLISINFVASAAS